MHAIAFLAVLVPKNINVSAYTGSSSLELNSEQFLVFGSSVAPLETELALVEDLSNIIMIIISLLPTRGKSTKR